MQQALDNAQNNVSDKARAIAALELASLNAESRHCSAVVSLVAGLRMCGGVLEVCMSESGVEGAQRFCVTFPGLGAGHAYSTPTEHVWG